MKTKLTLLLTVAIVTQAMAQTAAPDNHDAHDYAERTRERMP